MTYLQPPTYILLTDKKRPRILIADDEPGIRDLLHLSLCESYDCTEVCSAEEALARLRAENFDLILSDITMGGISGLEMVPLARECAPDTVVLMMSGKQTIDSAIQAMRAGAFDYIVKPFDLLHVEAAVSRALEHRALLETKRLYERHLEEKVNYLSLYDALTGLPNQNFFKSSCERELSAARNGGRKLAAIFLSVDRFKKIYETLGHEAGDKLLREIGSRLTNCVREDDTLAYFGGDEFALLLRQVSGAQSAVKLVGRVLEALKPAFNLDGQELFVSASLGISLSPDDGADGQTILKNAAAALDRAKQQGGGHFQFYTADMNATALKRLSLENDLHRALEHKEFVVHYQPQVSAETGRLTGMEALVRWQHPELGLVSPADFIPLAEETGLIVPLGDWVLRTACAQNRAWQEAGFAPVQVAVNFSPRQFQQPELVEQVRRALGETGLDPSYLDLELTESSIMKDAELTIRTLHQLKETGVRVCIDDFGTGYSSLSYLKRFPIDILKIDISFVRNSTTDPKDAAIVEAIITLAHSLNLKVIAEGVETEEQLKFLRSLGCDEVQGYLFGTPLPTEALRQILLKDRLPGQLEAQLPSFA